MQSKNIKVDNFLNDTQSASPELFELLSLIRKLFHAASPKFEEDIKYGGLVFNLSGALVGGIFVYKEHLSIEFSNGVELADPDRLLEGKGKHRRHLKIHTAMDIENRNAEFFIRQIAE